MSLSWFTKEMGVESGPFTSATLKVQASDGTITPDTLVRRGLNGDWVSAHRIHGLFEFPTELVREDHAPLEQAKPLPAAAVKAPSAAEVETLPDFPAIAAPALAPAASPRPANETSLAECGDCGQPISRRALVCPHCGCPNGENSAMEEPQLKSATLKRSHVGLVLSAIGIAATLYFLFAYDTTVAAEGTQVHNLGLVATQFLGVLISLGLVLLGAMPTSIAFKFEQKS